MAQEFEVTVRLRLTVDDSTALIAAAGPEAPEAVRDARAGGRADGLAISGAPARS